MMIQDKQTQASAQTLREPRVSMDRAEASERNEGAVHAEARSAEQGNEAVRPERETVLELVRQAEENLAERGVALKFKVNEDADSIQVEVREAGSEKVIRKIPADEVVQLSKSIKDMAGQLLDKPI